MKIDQYLKTLIYFTLLSSSFFSLAQNTANTSLDKNQISENLIKIFNKILSDAKINKTAPSSTCTAEAKEIITETRQMLKDNRNLFEKDQFDKLGLFSLSKSELSFIEKGNYKSAIDKALQIFDGASEYSDFVSLLTGKNETELNETEQKELKETFKFFREMFVENKQYQWWVDIGSISFRHDSCSLNIIPSYKVIGFEYPRVTYDLNIEVHVDCNCPTTPEGFSASHAVSSLSFNYKAHSEGLFSGTQITFGDPINPRIDIISEECCYTIKEEESYSAENDDDDDIVKYVFDYDWAGDGFSITVGAGPTIGEEADFFGFSYSGDIGYFHSLSDDFQIGATAGYARYTGKETDFGFETDGESFIPINARANYRLSNAFGVEAGLGYAISASEGGEGGLMYSAGPFWRPLEAVLIALNYVNISFGEGSLGAVMLSGRFSLSKK
ncbi:hypothetical protein [Flagellimonas eckloniae]|uniref:hypothetical protein n=1 Tax=Flagellimonas eckloniae TaxID=346185 RepID=UPI0006DBE3D3|nr:hypothetical protein [Allomuricauda eckloniae]